MSEIINRLVGMIHALAEEYEVNTHIVIDEDHVHVSFRYGNRRYNHIYSKEILERQALGLVELHRGHIEHMLREVTERNLVGPECWYCRGIRTREYEPKKYICIDCWKEFELENGDA